MIVVGVSVLVVLVLSGVYLRHAHSKAMSEAVYAKVEYVCENGITKTVSPLCPDCPATIYDNGIKLGCGGFLKPQDTLTAADTERIEACKNVAQRAGTCTKVNKSPLTLTIDWIRKDLGL